MSGKTVWTFIGLTATRPVDSDTYEPWYEAKLNYTRDLVLGATTAADSYLDVGAAEVPPLALRFEFASDSARQAFINLRGQTGTLSNTRGYSTTAMLVSTKRINTGMPSVFWLDLLFEAR